MAKAIPVNSPKGDEKKDTQTQNKPKEFPVAEGITRTDY